MNEEEARKILERMVSEIADNNDLVAYSCYSPQSTAPYVSWLVRHDHDKVALDGDLTVEQLKAIVWWMEHKTIKAVDRVTP